MSRLFDGGLILIAIVAGVALIGSFSYKFFKGKQDNVVEELCEDIIESQTGVKIDLTPSSPETNLKKTLKKKATTTIINQVKKRRSPAKKKSSKR